MVSLLTFANRVLWDAVLVTWIRYLEPAPHPVCNPVLSPVSSPICPGVCPVSLLCVSTAFVLLSPLVCSHVFAHVCSPVSSHVFAHVCSPVCSQYALHLTPCVLPPHVLPLFLPWYVHSVLATPVCSPCVSLGWLCVLLCGFSAPALLTAAGTPAYLSLLPGLR